MNYIPGFSNHLETALPRYAGGGAVTSNATTTGAVPDYNADFLKTLRASGMSEADIANLSNFTGIDDSLYGLNFASNFGGGASGGIYKDDPNLQYINAPISNKGNPTSPSGNVFTMTPDQKVRLVDLNTNTIVFEGTGYDAAREATRLGQSMTDSLGRKASYNIQTADPTGKYTTVANEKYNKSTLGTIADVAGTALPLAAMFIPGLNVLGSIAVGAGLGGAGAALKGDDILKGVAMGGLSAAGGQILGPALEAGGKFGTALAPKLATAVGTGLGSTAGGLVTGQSLKDSLLSGAASGALSYVAPTIANELGLKPINLNGTKGTSGSSGMTADGGLQVTASTLGTPSGVNISGGPSPTVKDPNEIVVDATKVIPPTSVSAPVTTGGLPTTTVQPNDIVVDATKVIKPTSVSAPVTTGGLPTTTVQPNDIVVDATKVIKPTSVSAPVTTVPSDTIVVTGGGKIEPTSVTVVPPTGSVVDTLPPLDLKPDPALTDKDGNKLGLEEYLRLLALAVGAVGGGGKGGGSSGTYVPGGRGSDPIFSANLPTANIPGGVGAASNLGARQMGDVDWLTYGTRPELSFYNYVPKPTGMAEGGMFAAKRGGQSRRTEFAVNGAGTGRSDDIPAVLSDGEYVIDAETVALLGDGSSKAGAKKLDDLRVKVRKHKGKKLAKGRFSANAKRPEAYLSGGRI